MLLAGPIVRRVTPRFVAVWVATPEPADLRLSIFDGIMPVGPGTGPVTGLTPRNESTAQSTVRVGANLHIGVVSLALPSTEQLLFGQVYSYNVTLTGAETEDLRSLGLLAEGPLEAGTPDPKPHLPLGYEPFTLPSFVVPPASLDDVRLYHASCRKPHGQDPDALAFLDDHIATERVDPVHRPHQLFLTGDQIYADDVPISLLPHLTEKGIELIGTEEELPITATSTVLVNQQNLPAGYRQFFARNALGFSSEEADSHLLSLGEYCAAYLFSFSNVVWPDMRTREDGIPDALAAFGHDIDVVRMSVEGMRDLQIALFEFPGMDEPPSQRLVEFFYNRPEPERTALFEKFRDKFLELKRVRDPGRDPEDLEFLLAEARVLISGQQDAEARRTLEAFREYTSGFVEHFECKTPASERQRRTTVTYHDALPKVRRALANVATYMIFDDHDVTDDWYVSRPWRARVHATSAGPVVLRNGLVAYGFFQGWGNDPSRFASAFSGAATADGSPVQLIDEGTDFSSLVAASAGKKIKNVTDDSEAVIRSVADGSLTTTPLTGGTDNTWAAGDAYTILEGENLPLLQHTPDLYGSGSTPNATAATALDTLLGSDDSTPEARWDFQVPGPTYRVRVLDTRTRREFLGLRDPPNLISPAALNQQLPAGPLEAGLDVLVVVSAAPVLDLPVLEELFKPLLVRFVEIGAAHSGDDLRAAEQFDLESWSANPPGFEALIARLATYERVLVLSGDVHYAGGAELSYWKGAATEPARIVQFTSSAAKNLIPHGEDIVPATRSTFGQRVIRLGVPLERLAWAQSDTDPVAVSTTESTAPSLRARLTRSPVLIPTEGWPPGTTLNVPPEWRWRLELLRDDRPDLERPDAVQPLPLEGPVTAEDGFDSYRRVARRHVDFLDKALFARQMVVATNIGRASFDTSGDAIVARHDIIGVHAGDPLAQPATYTRHRASLAGTPGETPPTL